MRVDKVVLFQALEEQQGLTVQWTVTLLYEVYTNKMKRSGPTVVSYTLVHTKVEKEGWV